jgi:GNAT superfamily N-acetyltransferase
MTNTNTSGIPDYFGDNEGVLDIQCRPALPPDFPQVAALSAGLLETLFGPILDISKPEAPDIILDALRSRLRHDCTWVMHEGSTVVGTMIIETVETGRLNGPPVPKLLAEKLGLTERICEVGLLPLMMHEPAQDEAHQSLVALLPGSRGEGRGTLLLMHGAFWAKAQGKDWMTAWLREDDPGMAVYLRRGYQVDRQLTTQGPAESATWILLRRPLSSKAYKVWRKQGR